MLCHRDGGRPENIEEGGAVIKNHLMEQVLLLNLPKIWGGGLNCPPSPLFPAGPVWFLLKPEMQMTLNLKKWGKRGKNCQKHDFPYLY